jgi:hypothetical protein
MVAPTTKGRRRSRSRWAAERDRTGDEGDADTGHGTACIWWPAPSAMSPYMRRGWSRRSQSTTIPDPWPMSVQWIWSSDQKRLVYRLPGPWGRDARLQPRLS